MLEHERHQIIIELLKEKNTVKLQELVELTKTSESTIRRDLVQLEKGKFLKRVHGGASRLQGKLQEPSMMEKSSKNLQEKRQIAKYAASLVEEGDSIYLDAGSTNFEMIAYLPKEHRCCHKWTNAYRINLLDKGIKTFLIGGYIKPTTKALIGSRCYRESETLSF